MTAASMVRPTYSGHRNSQSGAARFYRERMERKARNFRRFAEALADSSPGASIAQVAALVGLSQQTGSVYFREICRDIDGAQVAAGYGAWTD